MFSLADLLGMSSLAGMPQPNYAAQVPVNIGGPSSLMSGPSMSQAVAQMPQMNASPGLGQMLGSALQSGQKQDSGMQVAPAIAPPQRPVDMSLIQQLLASISGGRF